MSIKKMYSAIHKVCFLLFLLIFVRYSSLLHHTQIMACHHSTMPLYHEKRSAGVMQEIEEFLQEVDILFNKTKCTICSESIVTHVDYKTMSKCGHVYHLECINLWEFACTMKQKPFQCPDCHGAIVLFHSAFL